MQRFFQTEIICDKQVFEFCVYFCRHWQELGYLIIYITGRPDMQQSRVLAWLSQHNFPHGLVSFADGLSTDPLGHKATYLKNLISVTSLSKIAANTNILYNNTVYNSLTWNSKM